MSKLKNWLPRVIAALVAVLLVVGSILIASDKKSDQKAPKTIYVTVQPLKGKPISYKMDTTADTLKNALTTEGFISGEQTENGFIVRKIGETEAGSSMHWRLFVNDKATGKTVDRIKLHHNDKFIFKEVSNQNE